MKKILFLIKVVVLIHLLVCIVNGLWTATFICLFTLITLLISDSIKKKLKYNNIFDLLIYIFLTSSLIGGEIYNLYIKIWYYDIIMHTLSSFIISALLYYLLKKSNIKINTSLLILFIFSFAMMVESIWEITEFTIDRIFDSDMQKDTIITEINSKLLSTNGKNVVKNKINKMKIGDDIIDGYIDIGLYDTIEDMICAVCGSIIFIVIFKNKLKEAPN